MPRLSVVLRAAVRDLGRTGAAGVSGVVLCALAVLVGGGTVLGLEALARLTAAWRAELRVVAIVRDGPATPNGPSALVAAVRAIPGAGDVRYVSAGDALAELRPYLGTAAAGLDRLPANPLPARVEVRPAARLTAAELRGLVEALRGLPAVEDVEATLGWVETMERVERALRVGGLALGGLIGVAAAVAIAAATLVAKQRRADETAVLRLAGAPDACVRGPLLLQAVLLGVAGAALGWSGLLLVSEGGAPWLHGWLWAGLGFAPPPAPAWPLGLALVGGGLGVGLIGGLGAGRP